MWALPGSWASCVVTFQKGQERFLGLLYQATNLIHEGSALMTQPPPKGSTSNNVTLAIEFFGNPNMWTMVCVCVCVVLIGAVP